MEAKEHIENIMTCSNCITGKTEELVFAGEKLLSVAEGKAGSAKGFVGPGLIDLQINGVNGIDFNLPTLTIADIINATHYLLSCGVTSYFPTVITNSDENIITILRTIDEACKSDALVNACITGIHLEGPFLSPLEGARGAHSEKYIKAPDWELFKKFREASGGRIRIVTLAPEWENAPAFISGCRREGIIVSIGHSLANTQHISDAVAAGASMSTHLGNGIPLMLQRHPNIVWDQLAADALYACIIADGIHIPDSFIKVAMKVKGRSLMIVSDATCFAGMQPGEYESHIGGTVVLDGNKRISLKSSPGLLAGAAKTLPENIEALVGHGLCTLGEAWQMASVNIAAFLAVHNVPVAAGKNDLVVFEEDEGSVIVRCVVKGGKIVFDKKM
ncbi:MAG: N-acetylglucosamine-6-phosphate deacetylase [Sphingobacteriales bacterium]|nr:N-acetylglucosamine-6-phosphate deacetylase [Sphingobacteriales bacterium]